MGFVTFDGNDKIGTGQRLSVFFFQRPDVNNNSATKETRKLNPHLLHLGVRNLFNNNVLSGNFTALLFQFDITDGDTSVGKIQNGLRFGVGWFMLKGEGLVSQNGSFPYTLGAGFVITNEGSLLQSPIISRVVLVVPFIVTKDKICLMQNVFRNPLANHRLIEPGKILELVFIQVE